MLHARKLRRRSARDDANEFLIEGPVGVSEAIAAGLPVREVFVGPDAAEMADVAAAAGVKVHRVSERVIEALSDAVTPQGVVAVAAMPDTQLEDVLGSDLLLVLDAVRDPGNAGTLVRSALAAGAGGIVFGPGSVDPFAPKTVRSGAGAILQAKIVRAGALTDVLERLRRDGFSLVGAGAAAPESAYDVDLSGRSALVVGNEAHGLSPEVEARLDLAVRIPLPGPVESLNAAVAGSILLFECVRQRRTSR